METARDLTVRLRDLLRNEHGALADVLLTLATFDERRLWAQLEYGSLFDFLHRELGLSKGARSTGRPRSASSASSRPSPARYGTGSSAS